MTHSHKFLVLGVDPGLQGGLAFIAGSPHEDPVVLAGLRMPKCKDLAHTYTSSTFMVDTKEITKWIRSLSSLESWRENVTRDTDASVIFERAQTLPTIGKGEKNISRQRMFNYGFTYGITMMSVAQALTIGPVPYCLTNVHTVMPTVWKPAFGLKQDKQESIERATDIFHENKYWHKKADEGVAEAALIAHWRLNRLCRNVIDQLKKGEKEK